MANGKSLGDKLREWIGGVIKGILELLWQPIGDILAFGVEQVFNRGEGDLLDVFAQRLDDLAADPDAPPEIKAFAAKMHSPLPPLLVGILIAMAISVIITAVMKPLEPWLEKLGLVSKAQALSGLISPVSAIKSFWRDQRWKADMDDIMSKWGIPDAQQSMEILANRPMLDVGQLAALKFRTEGSDEEFIENVKRLGYSEDEAKRFLPIIPFYPSAQDLVNWLAKEVFEPDMIARYGLKDEAPTDRADMFAKAGVTEEQMLNYWMAHWQHASWTQVVEMLHRGLLTEAEVWEWFRLVEIPPFWRDKLIAMSWNVPTRVDVRRFWDMGTIDEARLRELYTAQGYHLKDLDDYVLWTKVYVAWPDMIARYSKGWITLDEVRAEMTALGMPADRLEEMIQTKFAAAIEERTSNERDVTKAEIVKGVKTDVISREQGNILLQAMGYDLAEAAFIMAINIPEDDVESVVNARELSKSDILAGLKVGLITSEGALGMLLDIRYTPADAAFILAIYEAVVGGELPADKREATKADIIKGVKKGIISPEQGYSMLLDIGFSYDAATFILSINIEEAAFSPHSFMEFQFLTEWYKGMRGKPAKIPPNDVILADIDYNRAKAIHTTLLAKKATENEILKAAEVLRVAEYSYGQLLVKWKESTNKGQTDAKV